MKTIVFLFIVLICALNIKAQSTEEIINSGNYIWGKGQGKTYKEADKSALSDLISKITVQVESSFENLKQEINDDISEYTKKVVKTYSNTKLRRADTRILEESSNKTVVLRYMKKSDMDKIFNDRKNKVIEFVSNGLKAEKEVRIADALRYYYWSIILLRSHPDYNSIKMQVSGKEKLLFPFLYDKLNQMLTDIDVDIYKIYYDKEKETKSIITDLKYRGKPIVNLDYIYYTGNAYSALTSIKDGKGVIELYGEPSHSLTSLRMKIEYDYENKCKYDYELLQVMKATEPPPYFRKADHLIDLNIKEKEKITDIDNTVSFKSEAKTIAEADFYIRKVEKIAESIIKNEHDGIKDLFTDDGYNMYLQLIKGGNVKVLEIKDTLNIILVNDEVMVRSVPMLFTYENNDRRFIENVVFVFNSKNKIDALSFTISDIAISDIVSKPEEWGSLEEKYLIIKFMEYFKTAYCLKRIDYLESVFADNALIIVGHVFKKGEPIDNMYMSVGDTKVKYIRHTKKSYIEALRIVFKSNEYVNIHFEDNEVKRCNDFDDKTYGIQIKQHYYSTNYADKGYLFLMIDLNDTIHPKIYVRTWQPEKFPDGTIFGLENFHF